MKTQTALLSGGVPAAELATEYGTHFASILEFENACGINFDEALLHHDQVRGVRSSAGLIESLAVPFSDQQGDVDP